MFGLIRQAIWTFFLDAIGRKIGMVLAAISLTLLAILYLGGKEFEQVAPRLVTVPAEVVAVDLTCTMRAPPTANGRIDGIFFIGSCSDAEIKRRANPGRTFTEPKRTTRVTVAFVTSTGVTVEARKPASDLGLDDDLVNAGDQIKIAYDKAKPSTVYRAPLATANRWTLYMAAGLALMVLGALAWVLDGFGGLDRMRRT